MRLRTTRMSARTGPLQTKISAALIGASTLRCQVAPERGDVIANSSRFFPLTQNANGFVRGLWLDRGINFLVLRNARYLLRHCSRFDFYHQLRLAAA